MRSSGDQVVCVLSTIPAFSVRQTTYAVCCTDVLPSAMQLSLTQHKELPNNQRQEHETTASRIFRADGGGHDHLADHSLPANASCRVAGKYLRNCSQTQWLKGVSLYHSIRGGTFIGWSVLQ